LPCQVWHPPKLGKARSHSSSPLSQSINNRSSSFDFHQCSSSSLSLSLGLFVCSSFPSHDSSFEPQLTSGRSLTFAMIDSIGPVSTSPIWSRLVPCDSAHDLPRLMARTLSLDFLDRCPSRLSPAPLRVIFDLPVSLSPSLSVLQFPTHSWLPTRSISVTTIVQGVLGDRYRHDKGASKVEPAQSYRLCAKTN